MSTANNNGGWDFTRLPESEHQRVLEAYAKGDVRRLIEIHDNYQLSEYSYCCNSTGLLAWFGEAIKNGTINGQAENT